MRAVVLATILVLTGCGTASKPATSTVTMTSKAWSIWVHNTADQNIVTVNAQLTAEACVGVVGPTCFKGVDIANTSDDVAPTPGALAIGVPVNPVPITTTDGYAFNFEYDYQTAAGVSTSLAGSGRFYPNGNVAGTWQCTGACTASTGDFTASQP